MKTVRQRAYAKLNLFLDITGTDNGFHLIDTVVTTVDLFDVVILTSRKDKKVVLKTGGSLYSITEAPDNNAYKAASLFIDTFSTCGVDITLKKNIPVGSGMGGSSADIAAVLNGMEKLYRTGKDLKPLADKLGSDSGYMLTGGWARLKGRGEIVEPLDINAKLHFLVITAEGGVNTSKCYAEYDAINEQKPAVSAEGAIAAIKGDLDPSRFYNALYAPAAIINPKVREAYDFISGLSPRFTLMSGSGSSVFGVFDTVELCQWAQAKAARYYKNVFVLQSLSVKELADPPFFAKNPFSL